MCTFFLLVPLRPSNFSITEQYDTISNTTITLEWSPPQGSGSEAVVDYYIFSISPTPLSHTTSVIVNSFAIRVTVEYNVAYKFNILAINCAGQSNISTLQNIKFGML